MEELHYFQNNIQNNLVYSQEWIKSKEKKEESVFALTCNSCASYVQDGILILHACRYLKSCHQGQCHCHSETVKVWSFYFSRAFALFYRYSRS